MHACLLRMPPASCFICSICMLSASLANPSEISTQSPSCLWHALTGSESPAVHLLTVFDQLLLKLPASYTLLVAAHSAAGCSVMRLLALRSGRLENRLGGLALLDSVHTKAQLPRQIRAPRRRACPRRSEGRLNRGRMRVQAPGSC